MSRAVIHTRARRLRWWWLLGGVGGVLLLATLIIVGSLVILGAASTTSVRVQNEGIEPLRLSGCSIDDALDLTPRATGNIDVVAGGPEGCSVFDHDGTRYLGCLTLPASHAGLVLVRQSLNPVVSARACEDMH